MDAFLIFFLFGLAAGWTIFRLRRAGSLMAWEKKLLRPLAWVLMVASFCFAAALLIWAAWG